ncbi:hypothetical protein JD844_005096, partial [Phrynosoma platyrhinos]
MKAALLSLLLGCLYGLHDAVEVPVMPDVDMQRRRNLWPGACDFSGHRLQDVLRRPLPKKGRPPSAFVRKKEVSNEVKQKFEAFVKRLGLNPKQLFYRREV